ncbi:hypothetical protein [Legionella spiritensis]|uniref:Inner membrane protein AmpE n=1 Tax=Legionella spiritensis TaxID=452 RepID=A0A0W0YXS7_LEGSP|nr:hypothetical protein [Legionella spiritensis]KTD61666.1 inner membrane protein AmpE [Legionella spiritensis]SNV39046.1 inner membrane protein AmpE [Legionella spiritensis]
MKLLVIVLCLFSERYLVHSVSHKRFSWFTDYFNIVCGKLPQTGFLANRWLTLFIVILPLFLAVFIVLCLFKSLLFGFIYLILNLIVFYYCLGPGNPFYPVNNGETEAEEESAAFNYFAVVNNQVFAIIFWYIILGPLAALVYRLVSLCRDQSLTSGEAQRLTDILDWIPARLTVLLYLLVGNFQHGLHFLIQNLFALPAYNTELLGQGGLLAARARENEMVSLPFAQSLVEHAMIVYLVFIAAFTLVAWL